MVPAYHSRNRFGQIQAIVVPATRVPNDKEIVRPTPKRQFASADSFVLPYDRPCVAENLVLRDAGYCLGKLRVARHERAIIAGKPNAEATFDMVNVLLCHTVLTPRARDPPLHRAR